MTNNQDRQKQGLRLWDLVGVGCRLQELANLPADSPLAFTDAEHPGVIESLSTLLRDLQPFDLWDSARLVRRIERFGFRLKQYRETGSQMLGEARADELCGLLLELRREIEQVSARQYVYVALPTNLVSGGVNQLLEDPSQAFELSGSVDPALLHQVDPYLREAGRCLAVGFWPAAVTCTLLAIEIIARWYCEKTIGSVPLRTNALQTLLKHLYSASQPADMVQRLKQIVDEYCGPAMYALLEQDNGTTAFEVWDECVTRTCHPDALVFERREEGWLVPAASFRTSSPRPWRVGGNVGARSGSTRPEQARCHVDMKLSLPYHAI